MSTLHGVILTVRFLCELSMLAALAYWGFDAPGGAWAWVLGIGAPLAIAIWGAFVAPKAEWPLPTPLRLMVELVLFGAAAVGLAVAGEPALAALLAVAAGATSLLNASTSDDQRPTAKSERFRGVTAGLGRSRGLIRPPATQDEVRRGGKGAAEYL